MLAGERSVLQSRNATTGSVLLRADEKLSAFLELERQVLIVTFYLESVHADSIRRRGVPYPG